MDNEIIEIYPQIVSVDDDGRIMGLTDIAHGVSVITEYNCSFALTEDGFAKYKLVEGEVIERTVEEIAVDQAKLPKPAPTDADRIRLLTAQVEMAQEQIVFLEDCILELADEVYS